MTGSRFQMGCFRYLEFEFVIPHWLRSKAAKELPELVLELQGTILLHRLGLAGELASNCLERLGQSSIGKLAE